MVDLHTAVEVKHDLPVGADPVEENVNLLKRRLDHLEAVLLSTLFFPRGISHPRGLASTH